jgi:hypothetical protein
VVFRATSVATALLQRDVELRDACHERGAAFAAATAVVASRLESRILRLAGAARAAEELWARREEALADIIRRGIAAPKVTLDCIGAVILAGSPLEA